MGPPIFHFSFTRLNWNEVYFPRYGCFVNTSLFRLNLVSLKMKNNKNFVFFSRCCSFLTEQHFRRSFRMEQQFRAVFLLFLSNGTTCLQSISLLFLSNGTVVLRSVFAVPFKWNNMSAEHFLAVPFKRNNSFTDYLCCEYQTKCIIFLNFYPRTITHEKYYKSVILL